MLRHSRLRHYVSLARARYDASILRHYEILLAIATPRYAVTLYDAIP